MCGRHVGAHTVGAQRTVTRTPAALIARGAAVGLTLGGPLQAEATDSDARAAVERSAWWLDGEHRGRRVVLEERRVGREVAPVGAEANRCVGQLERCTARERDRVKALKVVQTATSRTDGDPPAVRRRKVRQRHVREKRGFVKAHRGTLRRVAHGDGPP